MERQVTAPNEVKPDPNVTHAPGPWSYAPTGPVMEGYEQPFGIANLGESFSLIAGVFGDGPGGRPQAEANARLIASAPALLSALRDCAEALSRLPDVDGAYRATCLHQARAAIAAATQEGK